MEAETAFYRNRSSKVILAKDAVPLSLTEIPDNSVKFQIIPDNSTQKTTESVDNQRRFSNRRGGIFPENIFPVYIPA